MSSVKISPSVLRGKLRVPLSKSAAHRALIASALAGGPHPLPPDEGPSEDLLATRGALRSILSAKAGKTARVDCRESGSTLRFLIPVAAALGVSAEFSGNGRLPERPLGIYAECLPKHGIKWESLGGLPLKIRGKLRPGVYSLPGNVSSQFVTGLLFALPLLPGGSRIELTSTLESSGYVELTLEILRDFGITAQRSETGWQIAGNQTYRPARYEIERDWSQAAFFLEAAALGGHLELEGLRAGSRQGDRAAQALFAGLGAKIRRGGGLLIADPASSSAGSSREIDAAQIPDLVPALAGAAALFEGHRTRIKNAARLRLKESDRLAAMADGLNRLGGIRETPDGLLIDGVKALSGGRACGCGDHRVVMALAVAALKSTGKPF